MRVHNLTIIDICTGEVIYDDAEEYEGEVIAMKGGGGGSGKVSWPGYMMDFHAMILRNVNREGVAQASAGLQGDLASQSFIDIMNEAVATNPFTSMLAFDPHPELTTINGMYNTLLESYNPRIEYNSMWQGIMAGNSAFNFFSYISVYWNAIRNLTPQASAEAWEMDNRITTITIGDISISSAISISTSLIPSYISDISRLAPDTVTLLNLGTVVEDAADDFGDELDRQIEEVNLPRFERGMQDIGAVMSSAFVIGRAVIEEGRNRDVARFMSDLKAKATIAGRQLDYDNKNRRRELVMEDMRSVREAESKEQLGYRDSLMQDQINYREVAYKRDESFRQLNLQEDMDKRKLTFDSQVDYRDKSLTEGMELRKLYYADLAAYREVQTRLLGLVGELSQRGVFKAHELALQDVMMEMEWRKIVFSSGMDMERGQIVGKKDYRDQSNMIAEQKATWKLELFTYAANLLAGPGGGTSSRGRTSPITSGLSGALGGAAVGSMVGTAVKGAAVGGPWGAAIGAGVGAIAGIIGG